MATAPVVVGVDGSRESLRAVEWAALEALRHGTTLRIVSATAMPPGIHACDVSPRAVANAARGASAAAIAEALARAEEIAPGLPLETGLLAGPPAPAVAESGSGALMLVVGARGAGEFAALLLGSVSRYAAAHAPVPVVVVRQESAAVHREIAVGIRDPRDVTQTLPFAFEEAAAREAELVAVHAWHWRSYAGHLTDPAQVTAQASRQLAEVMGVWRDKYPGVRVRHDVAHGHPARILACYSVRSDLLVIGRHSESGAGPAIGSVQHAVLSHARGPVAVVPRTC